MTDHSDAPESTGTGRPLPVTIVGWWLLVTGAFQILAYASTSNPLLQEMWKDQGLNTEIIVIWSVIAGIGHVAAAIGILRGQRWGRTIYLVVGLLGTVAGAAILGSTLAMSLISVLIYGVFVFILTRPDAEAYFSGTYEPPAPERELRSALRTARSRDRTTSDLQRVFGILIAAGAGFLLLMAFYSAGLLLSEGVMAVVLTGFFLVPAGLALALATLLWGRTRWAGLVGWTLGVAGLWAALSGLSLMMAMDTEYWTAIADELESGMVLNRQSAIVISLFGVLALIAGVALVLRQRSKDAAAASRRLPEDANS